jgi:hypothetical protein
MRTRLTPSLFARSSRANRWVMLECTPPSERRPRRCNVDVVGAHRGDEPVPLALPDPPRGDRLVDLVRSLVEDPSGSEGVVADFGVTHVAVRAETYGAPVGAKRPKWACPSGGRRASGVVAVATASYSSRRPTPTPSRITRTSGPPGWSRVSSRTSDGADSPMSCPCSVLNGPPRSASVAVSRILRHSASSASEDSGGLHPSCCRSGESSESSGAASKMAGFSPRREGFSCCLARGRSPNSDRGYPARRGRGQPRRAS